jgi:transposase InsO family protein
MSRSTFYYHISKSEAPDKYMNAKRAIHDLYQEHKARYGYRRMTAALSQRGLVLNHKTVLKLMRQMGMLSKVKVKKYRSYRGQTGKIAANLLQRNFSTQAPNEKWVTDVTEFHLFGEKRFLSAVLDLHCQDLVAYTIAPRPQLSMTLDMLDQAFAHQPEAGAGLTLHSDQGWQYQHKYYCDKIAARGIRQSMSRKGNCLDNAVIESFFGLLKSELLYTQQFRDIDHFELALHEYLDYYNNQRIKLKCEALPPTVYRSLLCQKASRLYV